MATVKFYLDKRRQKKDGTYPIKLNVFHNKQIMIATQLSASEKEWNGNEYSVRAQNYKPRNIVARGIINKAETVIFTLEQQEKLKSTTDKALKKLIEDAISSKVENQKTFLYYLDVYWYSKRMSGLINHHKRCVLQVRLKKLPSLLFLRFSCPHQTHASFR